MWTVITSGRGCQYSMWGIVQRIADVNTAGITEVRGVITAAQDVVTAVHDVVTAVQDVSTVAYSRG